MMYLIGGAARCGKTTLAHRVRKDFDGQVISQDIVTEAIRSITTPESHPDIFERATDPIKRDDPPQKRIARLRRRDKVIWTFMKGYFDTAFHAGDSVLSEGCIWPSALKELDLDHRAVFIVDTSPDHAERLIHIRDTEEHNNWMRKRQYDDAYIHVWAQFNIERSKLIIQECEELGYPYFDIADGGIEKAHDRAVAYLLEE